MPPAGFEPVIPLSKRPQSHAFDGAATGIGVRPIYNIRKNILFAEMQRFRILLQVLRRMATLIGTSHVMFLFYKQPATLLLLAAHVTYLLSVSVLLLMQFVYPHRIAE
jgi:hypothetical protein